MADGVEDGGVVSVEVNVAVGKGVNVSVAVGGAKVLVAVRGVSVCVGVSVGTCVTPAVAVGGVIVKVGDGEGVPIGGALRIATIPAQ